MAQADFTARQRAFFAEVDEPHFRWQVDGPYFAATEAALLDAVALAPGERLLEIGCGQGANLVHLGRRLGPAARLFGLDTSPARAALAQAESGASCLCGDGARLPLADGRFQAVLIRDLLHHVPDRAAVLAEAWRVLAPGGRLTLIEPNGRNPLMAAAALAEPEERGMLASTAARALGEVRAAGFDQVRAEPRQPLPLSRLLLHHRLGRPALGRQTWVARTLAGVERLAGALPASLWAYFVVTARRPPVSR